MKNALLLIDLQIDFLSDNGRLPVGATNAERVISVANRMAAFFEERRWPIIVIFNQFKKNDFIGNYFRKYAAVEGTEGGELDPRILIHEACSFSKSATSAFTNPDFTGYLKQAGIDHVIMCGVYAEGCVRATAFDALRADMSATVLTDGVASNSKSKYKWGLSRMQKSGVQLLTADDYLQTLSNQPLEPVS